MTQDPEKRCGEPNWIDSRNDRKTPYTEEELELFVEGFISSMDDVAAWKHMVEGVGEVKSREVPVWVTAWANQKEAFS